jgi:hypothetical protein
MRGLRPNSVPVEVLLVVVTVVGCWMWIVLHVFGH